MSEFHEVDWQNASVQDRIAPNKVLFRLMVQLSKKLDVHFDVLLAEAQEKPVTTAGDPHRNFRRGEIAKERSHKIHEWIARNHFDWAQEEEPELFQVPRKSDWDQFLEKHAVEDGIRIVTENASEAVYLSELDDTGPSEFVFVLSTDSALPASPGAIARFETNKEFWVLRHPVYFIT